MSAFASSRPNARETLAPTIWIAISLPPKVLRWWRREFASVDYTALAWSLTFSQDSTETFAASIVLIALNDLFGPPGRCRAAAVRLKTLTHARCLSANRFGFGNNGYAR